MAARVTRRDLRLASGLVLFFYVTAHLVNHALGLISVAAAERGLLIHVAVWHSAPGTLILYSAVLTHVTLALLAIYEHRTLRMPPLELLRIALGLGIPTLLIGHAVATRLAFELYAHPPDYAHVVWSLWNSGRQGWQIALLVPGWLHGCLGLNFAYGRRSWYRRFRLPLFGAALLLPTFAVLGFLSMVKEVSLRAQDPSWVATTIGQVDDAQRLVLSQVRETSVTLYFGVIATVLLARLLRKFLEERGGRLISIGYPDRTIRVPRGWSVLEASRSHRIAHVSMCGGRARCSTCRVRVLAGEDRCPPAQESERETLRRIGAAPDTRLACQLRPDGDVSVVPLLTAAPGARPGFAGGAVERDIAVMLVDFRCQRPGRQLLPHDLLYALDRFGDAVGEVASSAGGVSIQFAGDRALVVFGLDVVPSEANRQALRAAADLDRRLDVLRLGLRDALACDAEHLVYLHTGMIAIGHTGARSTRTLTAVGSAIDLVRRLAAIDAQSRPSRTAVEGASRVFATRAVYVAAGRDPSTLEWSEWALPGGTRVDIAAVDDDVP